MLPLPLPIDTRYLATADAVAVEAARLITLAAANAIAERKRFRIVLAGGATPKLTYQRLAQTRQNWAAWHIFWSDERCLPVDDPERNSLMVQQTWLAHVGIPDCQIFPIPAELGATPAAARYAKIIGDRPLFDLVLLGMGEDGHTASLFPDAQNDDVATVIAVHAAPKPPAERVSLACSTLRACRQQLVLITGQHKARAMTAWRNGTDLPIARTARSDAWLLMDDSLKRALPGLASA